MPQTEAQSSPYQDPALDNEPVGQGDYVVRDGDGIENIAEAHGFFWETLWNLPENRALKDAREDPNVLLPGDRVFIPELRRKDEPGETEQLHRFRLKGEPAKLRIQVLQEGEPRADEPYVADVDGHIQDGRTDGDGMVEIVIPPRARSGVLKVGEGERMLRYELSLGHLDPYDSVRGVQARLNNLGYDAGAVDGELGAATRDALKRFQKHHEMDDTGDLDEPTCEKLREEHGS